MTAQLDLPRAAAVPGRVGQATAVEQSRAIAEVQAQVIVAQRMPRDVDRAVREMLRSCSRKALAEKAFYRFPRGGGQVSGESIVLAKELARCWGNLDYGIAELRRDDVAGESEMMAYAWDLETNTRPRTTFIVPHLRDKKGGPERLTDVRDVYENNANMGARRVREMIFNILPPWYIEDGKAACYETLAKDDSDGKTIAERAARAVERFGTIGVRPEQLTQKVGAPQAAWSAADLARLTVIFRSIERGESTTAEEFGTAVPAAPDLLAEQPARPPRSRKAAQPEPADRPTGAASAAASEAASGSAAPASDQTARPVALAASGQVGMIITRLERLGIPEADREARLRVAGKLARREHPIGSTKELTQDEATTVIRELDKCREPVDLNARLAELDAMLAEGTVPGDE